MKDKHSLWKTSSGVLTLLLVLPILAIFYTAIGETDDLFTHLMSTVMPTYIYNTIALTTGVMFVSLSFGVPSAWVYGDVQTANREMVAVGFSSATCYAGLYHWLHIYGLV